MRTSSTKRITSASVLAGALVAAAACHSHLDVGAESFVPDVQRTTSEAIAKKNLDASIDRADRMRQVPAATLMRLERARYYGTYRDLDRADEDTRDLVLDTDARRLLRARVLARLHRFDEAREILATLDDRAKEQAIEMDATAVAAQGRAEEARGRLVEARYPRDRMHHYGTWAIVEGAAGDFDAADADYRQGLGTYRDVSPFTVAGTLFAMGVMWSERAGDAARGEALYRATVERLPGFVTANVHLAELEAERDLDAAIARLEGVVARGTEDPEPHARLAQWYAKRGDATRAAEHRATARDGYEALLAKYPLAFADHAAEFYLAAGEDAGRALELATINLGSRPTARAYALAIRAAQAAGDGSLACTHLEAARERFPHAFELAGLACST